MIGVISKKNEHEAVKEFFQLFKTPWEFYKENGKYDVVILSNNRKINKIRAKLILIFESDSTTFDNEMGISLSKNQDIDILNWDKIILPIYRQLSIFKNIRDSEIFLEENSQAVGLKIKEDNRIILRIGYNLFEEIIYLLSDGQPVDFASIPTLENHIALLRKWIVDAGIPLVEIPPIPSGYDFIVCLTHDVDFLRISHHLFDSTMWGFVYRGLIGSFKDLIAGKKSFFQVFLNWKSVLTLPFVYLGIVNDFWFQFSRYLEIEKGLKSTYFFVPFKNIIGDKNFCSNACRRKVKYDITDERELVEKIIEHGNEVGVHGIDAWHNNEKGYQELKRISRITGKSKVGIRMHWLFFDKQTFQTLDKAGYNYDSTVGYNETVGYRGGTTQVFCPFGVKKLLELPLHIQDTALFYPRRMDLSEKQALMLCNRLIHNALIYGGILTINWHQRSLAPERLWGDFYLRLLKIIQNKCCWFVSASLAVDWFRKRRAVFFTEVKFTKNEFRIRLKSDENDIQPPLVIRIYNPAIHKLANNNSSLRGQPYFDLSWRGEKEIKISI